jgi:hypothetical protein
MEVDMARFERFTFLCTENERDLIALLARQLQRSQSDAVRFVVINAAKEIGAQIIDPFPGVGRESFKMPSSVQGEPAKAERLRGKIP